MLNLPRKLFTFWNSEARIAKVFFLLASSHHHPLMNFYHISLLLLMVLSAYSGSPQHAKPPDSPNPIRVTNNSSAQLGILAPGLPQNEVYRSTLPQNEVFRIVLH